MKKTRLLLADNNLSYLEIARKMLRYHNEAFQVDVVTSGQECLEKLLEHNYQLLILDYGIDDKNGLEILSRIIKTGLDIPVVMLIDDDKKAISSEAMEKGAFDYIIKASGHLNTLPFTITTILDKVKRSSAETARTDIFTIKDPSFLLSNTMSESNGKGYYILDRKGRFVSTNKKLEEKLNYSEEELQQLTLDDLILPEQLRRYFQWLAALDIGSEKQTFETEIIGKHGDTIPVVLSATPVRDKNDQIINYKGSIKFKHPSNGSLNNSNGHFPQAKMIDEMTKLINFSYESSLNHLLEKITQVACKLFRFKRATLALLDRRRKSFIKQIMIGHTDKEAISQKILEVPQDVIEKIFAKQFKVRVIYHNQEVRHDHDSTLPILEERRLQKRDKEDKWHPQNVIILNLTDNKNKTFGYISLDEPITPVVPSREVFYNMEIFSKLTSLAIENFYRYAAIEKRNRRLKRLLVTGNIFKLNLSGMEIMKESVWSVKFSMDFNLVILGLINSKSGQLEIKSVACDDRIKMIQLKEISIPVEHIRTIFRKEYKQGKSYLVSKPEPALKDLKDIYYDTKIEFEENRYWQWWTLLVVPIYEKSKKVIGFLIVDDPTDCLLPSHEIIHTLEIFATQLSIAIENRVTYLHLRNRFEEKNSDSFDYSHDRNEGGLSRLVETFFK